MSNDDDSEKWKNVLNLVKSHLLDTQNFTNPRTYTTFHHPLLTALPPKTPINPNPTEFLFLILKNDEKISTKLFARTFAWVNENILHDDVETGGRVKEKWETILAAIVHPDSTIAYYKVHDGIHKPLEGMAGV